jgi:hypothetical protein
MSPQRLAGCIPQLRYLLLNGVAPVLGVSKADFEEPLGAKFAEFAFHALG